MASLDRDPRDPVCCRCSKPVTRGTAAQYAGRPVHMRCLARATQLDSIEQQDRASRERERTEALVEQASELMTRTRAVQRVCPVCERPLKDTGSLLFQDDLLVHAICWRAERSGIGHPGTADVPSCAVCRQPLLGAGGHMIDPAGRHFHVQCPPREL
jgi:hypothetical protein